MNLDHRLCTENAPKLVYVAVNDDYLMMRNGISFLILIPEFDFFCVFSSPLLFQ